MSNGIKNVINSTQEQATAAWIDYLKWNRFEACIRNLKRQDINLEEALREIDQLKKFIGDPAHILGNASTKHGEIAEQIQVYVSNARNLIKGKLPEYTFEGVGRTSPEDYLFNGEEVQSKFYNGAKNTLNAVREHLKKYPYFIKNGGSYDIPQDQYDEIVRVYTLAKTNPSQLGKSDRSLLKVIQEWENEAGHPIMQDIKAAVTNYGDVQQGKVLDTINNYEQDIYQQNQNIQEDIINRAKPKAKEGLLAVAVGAALEGGVAFAMAVAEKRRQGIRLADFTVDDWKDVGIDFGKGSLKGGIRGGTVYALTNYTVVPGNVASAYVTAAFGVASLVGKYRMGHLSKEDFLIESEAVCLDSAVSMLASGAGQILIPIPILGALIGNIAGGLVYEECKKIGFQIEMESISGYMRDMASLNQQLDKQYSEVVSEIMKAFKRYISFEQMAFDTNVNIAFEGSILLAVEVGVDAEKILKTKKEIDNYFLG